MSLLYQEHDNDVYRGEAEALIHSERASTATPTTDHEERRRRERDDLNHRRLVSVLVKLLNFALVTTVLAGLIILYLKLDHVVQWNWFLVGVPWFLLCAFWLVRSGLKMSALPPAEVLAVSVSQYGTRPVEAHVRSITFVTCVLVSLVLLGLRLQGIVMGLTALAICAPIITSFAVFLGYGTYNVCVRGNDPNLTSLDNRRRKSTMRVEMVIYLFSFLTVLLSALQIDQVFHASWFLILAWPIIVLSFWGIAALGLTCLIVGWIASVANGRVEELDALLSEVAGPGYRNTSGARMKALGLVGGLVLSLDLLVCFVFVATFQLIRLLSGSSTSLETLFIPLILGDTILLCLMGLLEFFIMPHLQAIQLLPEESTIISTGPGGVLEKVNFGVDGVPQPINGCITCRQPVSRIVKIDDPHVHIVNTESKPLPDCSICMLVKSDTLFLPCGHSGVCHECAQRWTYGATFAEIQAYLAKTKSSSGRQDIDIFGGLSPVQTPLYLVQQSRTFFKTTVMMKPDLSNEVVEEEEVEEEVEDDESGNGHDGYKKE